MKNCEFVEAFAIYLRLFALGPDVVHLVQNGAIWRDWYE